MLLAFLVQTGVCAPTEFNGSDGAHLTVLVCPMMKPAGAPPAADPAEPPAPPKEDMGAPPPAGKSDL
jgi:hypothetical protein